MGKANYCGPGCECGRHRSWDDPRRRVVAAEYWNAERRAERSVRLKGFRADGSVASGAATDRVGYVYLTGQQDHPLGYQKGTVAQHRVVLYDKIGPGIHLCHWGCGRWLGWGRTPHELCADHVNGDVADNRPENVVQSCRSCNGGRRNAGNPFDWASPHPGHSCAECSSIHKRLTEARRNG